MPLALNEAHDIYLGPNSVVAVGEGVDAVVQGLITRLKLFRGEWFLNANAGMPWFQEVFTDGGQDIRRIESAIRSQINSAPGVLEIISLDVDFSASTRDLSISFNVSTTEGESGLIEVSP